MTRRGYIYQQKDVSLPTALPSLLTTIIGWFCRLPEIIPSIHPRPCHQSGLLRQ